MLTSKYFDILQTDGTAVGFMSLSDDVDLELLNSSFELNPFHGLHKPHPDDVLTPPTPVPGKSINFISFFERCRPVRESIESMLCTCGV